VTIASTATPLLGVDKEEASSKRQRDTTERRLDGAKSQENRKKKQARRKKKRNATRQTKQAERDTADPEQPIRLHLRGSFQFDLGAEGKVSGKGDVTIELDPATFDKVRKSFDQKVNDVMPTVRDLSLAVTQLPDVLKLGKQTLKHLSDPKTQENLKRAEEVLHLINGKSDHAQKKE
jgi:hypothetical protein